MASMVCPSRHERFGYDGRAELEEALLLETSPVTPAPPRTYRSGDQVVHSCPINSA
jgi:hypothetical protein